MHWPVIAILAVVLLLPAKRADIRLPGIVIPSAAAKAPPAIPRKK